MAVLLAERNEIEERLARLLGRPASAGAVGEWIAARVFDIRLEDAANNRGFDGRFTNGPLAGRSVNIKLYGRRDLLDITPAALPDYYLVLTGPRSDGASTRGTHVPIQIAGVYLRHPAPARHRSRSCPSPRRPWWGTGASVRRCVGACVSTATGPWPSPASPQMVTAGRTAWCLPTRVVRPTGEQESVHPLRHPQTLCNQTRCHNELRSTPPVELRNTWPARPLGDGCPRRRCLS